MSVMNYVSSEIKIIAVKHSLVGTESLNQSAARFGVSPEHTTKMAVKL